MKKITPQKQNGVLGEEVILVCEARASPEVSEATWKFMGDVIDQGIKIQARVKKYRVIMLLKKFNGVEELSLS